MSCLCYTEHAYFWFTRNSEPYHGSNPGPYAEKNGQNVARLLVSSSANACSMRRALTPSRSETHFDVRFLEGLQPVVELTLSFVPDTEQRLWRTVMRRKAVSPTAPHPGSPLAAPRARDSIALGRDGACPRGAAHRRAPGVGGANAVPELPTPAARILRGRLHDDFPRRPARPASRPGRADRPASSQPSGAQSGVAVNQSVIARANSQFRTRTPRAGNCAGSRV